MSRAARLLRAGLVTGVVDFTWAIVLTLIYRSTVTRLWQGVASVLIGQKAFEGGASTVALGVLMHFAVAFTWSAVFLFLVLRSRAVRDVLASPYGIVKVAAVYGPFIWAVMSLLVIPALVHRPPTVSVRWWIQLLGHIPFVGVPIVAASGREPVRP
jgi:hypothetical protein